HQSQEIQRYHGIELALAVQARAERVGNFLDPQTAAGAGDDIEQNLETLRGKLRSQLLKAVPADHEEAAHGIGDLHAQQAPGGFGRERARPCPLLVEAFGAAALDVAAADHKIEVAALQEREHFRKLGLVVLQVGIYHGCVWSTRGQNIFDAGSRQAASPDPPDTAHPAVF